jgi:hypothetical protein
MQQVFKSIFRFLETKTGFLVLGFLVTTVGGSILNNQIQVKSSENEHTFEMYKIRLSEAKALQKAVLAESNARSFYLHQVLAQIAHPQEYPRDAIQKFWDTNIEPAKDQWNKDLYYFHAQSRVLYSPELANMLLVYTEDLPIVHDPVIERLDDEIYKKTKPKTLHGALVNAHATVYHLLRKCSSSDNCPQAELMKLADKQLAYLGIVQSCFAYRISSELLQYPYGPKAEAAIQLPEQCAHYSDL